MLEAISFLVNARMGTPLCIVVESMRTGSGGTRALSQGVGGKLVEGPTNRHSSMI